MKSNLSLLVLSTACLLAIGCSSGRGLPPAAEQALRNATDFELLSLDPDRTTAETSGFHGWEVLGKTTITDAGVRNNLIAAFKDGVPRRDIEPVDCFNPRHGIKLVSDGTTHEFVICFECYQVEWHSPRSTRGGFQITSSPQETFDRILKDSKAPLPEQTSH
mgnify:FL=1